MNVIAGTEQEWIHLGIPIPCLMAEMNTRFQQVTHGYVRHFELRSLGLCLHASHDSTPFEAPKIMCRCMCDFNNLNFGRLIPKSARFIP